MKNQNEKTEKIKDKIVAEEFLKKLDEGSRKILSILLMTRSSGEFVLQNKNGVADIFAFKENSDVPEDAPIKKVIREFLSLSSEAQQIIQKRILESEHLELETTEDDEDFFLALGNKISAKIKRVISKKGNLH